MKTDHKEKDLFVKLCRFCAYRERAEIEVFEKMQQLEIKTDLQQKLIAKLKEENFLNEERYAVYYAKGKFRNNQWGKLKIALHLKMKKIKKETIAFAINQLDDKDYIKTINALINSKNKKYKEPNLFKKKSKIANYLYNKGFETDIIWDCINESNID